MKYLPGEQLAKVANTYDNKVAIPSNNQGPKLIKQRPEFSFATLEYMKKYNLISAGKPNIC